MRTGALPSLCRAASGASSGWARWPLAARATVSCACWRGHWPPPPARVWANWRRAAMLPAPRWLACCRIAGRWRDTRRAGQNVRQMLEQSLGGYLLLNTEPWSDAGRRDALVASTMRCVVAVSARQQRGNEAHRARVAAGRCFSRDLRHLRELEAAGKATAVLLLPGASRPAWKILRVLRQPVRFRPAFSINPPIRCATNSKRLEASCRNRCSANPRRAAGGQRADHGCADVSDRPDRASCRRCCARVMDVQAAVNYGAACNRQQVAPGPAGWRCPRMRIRPCLFWC